MRYWQLMAGYDAETTTFSECAKTGLSSPYYPVEDAQLVGLRMVSNRDAVTTLQNHVQAKLTSSSFTPNSIHCAAQGGGLQTAPMPQAGITAVNDWECSQPVRSGTPITIEMRNITEDTPVTVDVLLYGLFDNGK